VTQPFPTDTHPRRFVLLLALAWAATAGLLWYFRPWGAAGAAWPASRVAALVLWTLAAALVVVAASSAARAQRIRAAWIAGGRAVGTALTLVLFAAFFAVVLPFFLFVRLSDPLRKTLGAQSYWEAPRPDEHTMDRLLRPY